MMRARLPWSPFQELLTWHREIDDLFNRLFAGRATEEEQKETLASWRPAVEAFAQNGHHIVRFDLPGVDPKNVEVSVVDDTLIVKGERKVSDEVNDENYRYSETSYGRFERRVALPRGVEGDKVSASYKNGVLEIAVPLPVQRTGKTIPIQTEEGSTRKLSAA